VDALRAVRPDLYISTDVIVGFPGETEEDFEATRKAFVEVGFDMGFIFKYSVRPGTTAEVLGDPIPKEVKEARNQILLQHLSEQSLARNQALVGTVEEVLLEEPARRGQGLYTGRTRGFRRVVCPASERLVGQLVPVRILSATSSTLNGELELSGLNGVDSPELMLASTA
jgi:tRNA-2-methylthio-N6-dimethylallyladenosine synthase